MKEQQNDIKRKYKIWKKKSLTHGSRIKTYIRGTIGQNWWYIKLKHDVGNKVNLIVFFLCTMGEPRK